MISFHRKRTSLFPLFSPLFYTDFHQRADVPTAFLKWVPYRNATALTCWFSSLQTGFSLGGDIQQQQKLILEALRIYSGVDEEHQMPEQTSDVGSPRRPLSKPTDSLRTAEIHGYFCLPD